MTPAQNLGHLPQDQIGWGAGDNKKSLLRSSISGVCLTSLPKVGLNSLSEVGLSTLSRSILTCTLWFHLEDTVLLILTLLLIDPVILFKQEACLLIGSIHYTVFKIAIFARHRVGQNSSMIALKTANSGPIRGAKNSFSLNLWVCKNNPTQAACHHRASQ